MAKLPAESIKKLERFAKSFVSTTKVKGFRYEDFEDRAEELEALNPGKGYQLAYQATMIDLFRPLLDRYLREEPNVPTLKEFVQYYDAFLMNGYLNERKAQGMEVNIQLSGKGASIEVLESFREILEEHPSTTTEKEIKEKFDSGELTLDNTYDMAKAKEKTNATPTRKEARELVVCAEILERRNQQRPVWRMLLSLWTHFKERSAIKMMRNVARRCDKIAVLTHDAKNENADLKKLRDDVSDGIAIEKDRAQLFTAEIIAQIESEPIKQADESVLDRTLDLGDVEGDLLGDDLPTDDPVAEGTVFSDESIIMENEELHDIEKVAFDEEDIDIFPKNAEPKKTEIKAPAKNTRILQ